MIYEHTSLIGKRPTNEDSVIIYSDNKPNGLNIYCIFDGHGGKQVSKYLKDNILSYFVNKTCSYPLKKKYIIDVFNKIQDLLSKEKFSIKMGSTALILIIYTINNNTYANIINLGDCRAVLCRDNLGIPLTKDHKPNFPEEIRRIKKLGGNITFDGMDWRIGEFSVSRAFGDCNSKPYISHIPDVFKYKLDKEDKFIILACDGLWDVVNSQDAVNLVLNTCYNENTDKKIKKNVNTSKNLANYAIMKGSTDNVSVIIIYLNTD